MRGACRSPLRCPRRSAALPALLSEGHRASPFARLLPYGPLLPFPWHTTDTLPGGRRYPPRRELARNQPRLCEPATPLGARKPLSLSNAVLLAGKCHARRWLALQGARDAVFSKMQCPVTFQAKPSAHPTGTLHQVLVRSARRLPLFVCAPARCWWHVRCGTHRLKGIELLSQVLQPSLVRRMLPQQCLHSSRAAPAQPVAHATTARRLPAAEVLSARVTEVPVRARTTCGRHSIQATPSRRTMLAGREHPPRYPRSTPRGAAPSRPQGRGRGARERYCSAVQAARLAGPQRPTCQPQPQPRRVRFTRCWRRPHTH